jgi:polysaccharide biosynthesis protein PslJ
MSSLLIDPRVRFRGTIVDKPLLLFAFTALLSLIFNKTRVNSVSPDVNKKLIFFASFILVMYLVVSVIRRYRDIDFLVRVLVGGGTVVAFFGLIESRTGYNVFNQLNSFIPYLKGNNFEKLAATANRGARLRVFASAQHPIALGAALTMLIPLAIYLARSSGQKRWWISGGLLTMGALATVSRTAVLMMVTMIAIFIWLRPVEMRRLWPLIIPGLLLIHFAIPGTLGTLRASFLPKGGLVAQQQNQSVGSGRIATLGPALHTEFKPNPLFGEGFATRVPVADEDVPVPNGPILDNQWLGTLLETGVVGAFAFGWIFLRFVRRLGREAKEDLSSRGWLLASFAASVGAFGVGMFFYDAFAFIQCTFLLFIFLGLGMATFRTPKGSEPPPPRRYISAY